MTPKEYWRSRPNDPICAYLDGFYSWPVLAVVIVGMIGLCAVGWPMVCELFQWGILS